jgi:hypothetical protein
VSSTRSGNRPGEARDQFHQIRLVLCAGLLKEIAQMGLHGSVADAKGFRNLRTSAQLYPTLS